MGEGIARNLVAAGIPVRAWNRTAAKIEELAGEEGVLACSTLAEAVDGASVILTVLSDAEAVLAAVEGDDGAAAAADSGAIWVQASTIGIQGTERCAKLAEGAGLRFVDAPVLGTKKPAEEGQLLVLASGPEDVREELAPVFAAIGKETKWVGEAGAGTRLKVAVNAWIVSVVEGAAETLSLAEGIGVDPRQVLEAVAGGPLDLPYLQIKGKAMLEGDFEPSFRLALAAKDAGLALDAAASAGLELPMLKAIRERLDQAAAEHGDKDMAATYLLSAPGGDGRHGGDAAG